MAAAAHARLPCCLSARAAVRACEVVGSGRQPDGAAKLLSIHACVRVLLQVSRQSACHLCSTVIRSVQCKAAFRVSLHHLRCPGSALTAALPPAPARPDQPMVRHRGAAAWGGGAQWYVRSGGSPDYSCMTSARCPTAAASRAQPLLVGCNTAGCGTTVFACLCGATCPDTE